MDFVSKFWHPAALFACRVTWNEPIFANVFCGFVWVEVLPSPNVQAYEVTEPIVAFVNVTGDDWHAFPIEKLTKGPVASELIVCVDWVLQPGKDAVN